MLNHSPCEGKREIVAAPHGDGEQALAENAESRLLDSGVCFEERRFRIPRHRGDITRIKDRGPVKAIRCGSAVSREGGPKGSWSRGGSRSSSIETHAGVVGQPQKCNGATIRARANE